VWEELPHDDGASVRKVHRNGTEVPVIVVHGNMKVFYQLSRSLGKNRPVGLKFAHQYEGMALPFGTSIEDLAANTIEEFSDFLEDGSCIIAGYSAGAAIAQEMARHITDRKGDVDLLCLLDPPSRLSLASEEYNALKSKTLRALHSTYVKGRFVCTYPFKYFFGSAEDRRLSKIEVVTALAVNRFNPKPRNGRTLVISTVPPRRSSVLYSEAQTEQINAHHQNLLSDKDTSFFVVSHLVSQIRELDK
jgi:pimeloyl-ACP methyl ester carboxylesterase